MDADIDRTPENGNFQKAASSAIEIPDPLIEDKGTDQIIRTTRRALCRVALVAAETGARFQREAIAYDAMAWMLSPRRIFDGAAAIDACLELNACVRGVMVHGLGLGLDPDREIVDVLMSDEGDGRRVFDLLGHQGMEDTHRRYVTKTRRLRLYTATIADTRDNMMVQAFHASMARSAGEVRARLAGRFGPDIADTADIRLGIHQFSPVVVALVPQAVIELIRSMQGDQGSPVARTFGVDIQQCIRA